MHASRRSGAEGFSCTPRRGEPDTGEHENAEGFAVPHAASPVTSSQRFSGRPPQPARRRHRGRPPAIRSGSVTGSRQRAHLPR